MPAAVKLQKQLGDAVQILLVEHVHTRQQVQSLAISKKWMDPRIMWTDERPFYPTSGIPSLVLLSATGEIMLSGSAVELHDQALALLERELKTPRSKSVDVEVALRRIDQAIDDGYFAHAAELCNQLKRQWPAESTTDKLDRRTARLANEALTPEITAEKTLRKAEVQLYTEGASTGVRATLSKLDQEHPRSRAAARARELLEILKPGPE